MRRKLVILLGALMLSGCAAAPEVKPTPSLTPSPAIEQTPMPSPAATPDPTVNDSFAGKNRTGRIVHDLLWQAELSVVY